VQQSADLITNRQWRIGAYMNGQPQMYQVDIPSGTPQLKATLAWTDPAGSPSAAVALQNDLDLVLRRPMAPRISPGSWTERPGSPCRQRANTVDNVEQVLVPSPRPEFGQSKLAARYGFSPAGVLACMRSLGQLLCHYKRWGGKLIHQLYSA